MYLVVVTALAALAALRGMEDGEGKGVARR